jgi:UDP-N-acetylglucosamine 1-carboxyvinyltransferase
MGINVIENDDSVTVDAQNCTLNHVNIKTMPYPGFPTDMHPQFGVLMAIAKGQSVMYESIYEEKRFKYIDELIRMGAKVTINGKTANFTGVEELRGAKVRSADLRAGAAVVIAGLCAKGKTEVDDIHLIERGYDSIVEKLSAVGADIRYIELPDYV